MRGGSLPEHLQVIQVPTITNRQCKRVMRGVTRGEICTRKGHLESACGVRNFYNIKNIRILINWSHIG